MSIFRMHNVRGTAHAQRHGHAQLLVFLQFIFSPQEDMFKNLYHLKIFHYTV